MEFNFDENTNRRNTGSLKWDVADNELPMWVADMDFKTAPAVRNALQNKVKQGIFGYHIVTDEWYTTIQSWWNNRHNFEIKKDSMIFSTVVVAAISSSVQRITNVGDSVLVLTPVYDIFFHSIENFGRHTLECSLAYSKGEYTIDFADLEEKLSRPLTTMMIMCNPQNPSGKIWSREELAKVGTLCKKYSVTVLSDEVHCDIVKPGTSYIPFASASEDCRDVSMTCISPSKAFNIAGINTAAVIIPCTDLRQKVDRGLNSNEVAEPGAFSIAAAVAAYGEGGPWLDALCKYIDHNMSYAVEYIKKNISEVIPVAGPSSYLLWLDCRSVVGTDEKASTDELADFIRKSTGLYITAGSQYRGDGRYYLRANLGCQHDKVIDGMDRLKRGIEGFLNR